MHILWKNKKNSQEKKAKVSTGWNKKLYGEYQEVANWLDDEEKLRKISSIDFIAKGIRYHGCCRTEYQARARKTPKGKEEEINRKEPVETNWHIERRVFTSFWKYRIICSGKYHASLSYQNMENKLLKRLGDEVCIIKRIH